MLATNRLEMPTMSSAGTAILWGAFALLMLGLVFGLVSMFSLCERLGHGGLALDVDWEDDLDHAVHEARE